MLNDLGISLHLLDLFTGSIPGLESRANRRIIDRALHNSVAVFKEAKTQLRFVKYSIDFEQ